MASGKVGLGRVSEREPPVGAGAVSLVGLGKVRIGYFQKHKVCHQVNIFYTDSS